MFSYDEETQSYKFSLFSEENKAPPPAPGNAKEQGIDLRTDYNVFQQATFHDVWFCEAQYCENSFWFGGKHHCRMCGNTVCDEHSVVNVFLSTRLMPVIVDKLPNIVNPILAASKGKLPETLEFQRACLKCCNDAKVLPKPTEEEVLQRKLAREERRRRRAEQKEAAEANHWLKDESLVLKVQMLKAKKEALNRPRGSEAAAATSPVVTQQQFLTAAQHPANYVTTPSGPVLMTDAVSASHEGHSAKRASNEPSEESKSSAVSSRPALERSPVSYAATVTFSAKSTLRDPAPAVKSSQAESAQRLLVSVQDTGASVQTQKTEQNSRAIEMLERAAAQLQAAKVTQDAANQAKLSRAAKLNQEVTLSAEDAAEQELLGNMSAEELALYSQHQERLRAESEKDLLAAKIAAAKAKAGSNLAALMMKRSRQAQNDEHDAKMREYNTTAKGVLSGATSLVLIGLAKYQRFKFARTAGDADALRTAAVDLIIHCWRLGVARRRMSLLTVQRRRLVETQSASRLQAWVRMQLTRHRAAETKSLQQHFAQKEAEAVRLRELEDRQRTFLKLRNVLCKFFALVRFRRRLGQYPHILLVGGVAVTASYASQQVILSAQSGLGELPDSKGTARSTLLSKSRTVALYRTKENAFASNAVCHEQCVLTNITVKSNLCLTLVDPNKFVQSVVCLGKHPAIFRGKSVNIITLPTETTAVPLTDAAGKSVLPANLGNTPGAPPGLRCITAKLAPYAFSQAGAVLKQANSLVKDFKPRHLVLTGGVLTYFEDEFSLHAPRGTLRCSEIMTFAYGPDKTPDGESTLHISDGKEDWYLRFPHEVSRGYVRSWLRKIQYASPQVRLNASTLPFAQLLEYITSPRETMPVLRPTAGFATALGGIFSGTSTKRKSVAIKNKDETASKATDAQAAASPQKRKSQWGASLLFRSSSHEDGIVSGAPPQGAAVSAAAAAPTVPVEKTSATEPAPSVLAGDANAASPFSGAVAMGTVSNDEEEHKASDPQPADTNTKTRRLSMKGLSKAVKGFMPHSHAKSQADPAGADDLPVHVAAPAPAAVDNAVTVDPAGGKSSAAAETEVAGDTTAVAVVPLPALAPTPASASAPTSAPALVPAPAPAPASAPTSAPASTPTPALTSTPVPQPAVASTDEPAKKRFSLTNWGKSLLPAASSNTSTATSTTTATRTVTKKTADPTPVSDKVPAKVNAAPSAAPEVVPIKASPPPATRPEPQEGLSPNAANKWGNSLFARTSTPYSPTAAQLKARRHLEKDSRDFDDSHDDAWAECASGFPSSAGVPVEAPVRVKRDGSGSSSDWSVNMEESDQIRRELAETNTAAPPAAEEDVQEDVEQTTEGEIRAVEDRDESEVTEGLIDGASGPVLMNQPATQEEQESEVQDANDLASAAFLEHQQDDSMHAAEANGAADGAAAVTAVSASHAVAPAMEEVAEGEEVRVARAATPQESPLPQVGSVVTVVSEEAFEAAVQSDTPVEGNVSFFEEAVEETVERAVMREAAGGQNGEEVCGDHVAMREDSALRAAEVALALQVVKMVADEVFPAAAQEDAVRAGEAPVSDESARAAAAGGQAALAEERECALLDAAEAALEVALEVALEKEASKATPLGAVVAAAPVLAALLVAEAAETADVAEAEETAPDEVVASESVDAEGQEGSSVPVESAAVAAVAAAATAGGKKKPKKKRGGKK